MKKPPVEHLRELVEQGWSDPKIARKYGVSDRTVLRWRQAERLPSRWEPDRAKCGTKSAYNAGCRCDDCRDANTKAHRQLRVDKDRYDITHGTASGYFNFGCHCEPCKTAGSEQNRRMRLQMVERGSGKHGQSLRIAAGCRCDECQEGMRASATRTSSQQHLSRASATSHRHQWTQSDLEHVLARDDRGQWLRPAPEVAKQVGRTIYAIRSIRSKERKYGRLV